VSVSVSASVRVLCGVSLTVACLRVLSPPHLVHCPCSSCAQVLPRLYQVRHVIPPVRAMVSSVLYSLSAWRTVRTVVHYPFVRGLDCVALTWGLVLVLSFKLWRGASTGPVATPGTTASMPCSLFPLPRILPVHLPSQFPCVV
jgi:hypothetical protein